MAGKTDFFIVGAPKAGTTSLHNSLALHPGIFMPGIKEPNYFSSKELQADNLYYREKIISSLEEYESLYAPAGSRLKGDASVSYLFYPKTAGNIFEYNPEARIIMLLRQPVERAVSHYLMDYRLGFVKASLQDIFFQSENFNPACFQQYFLLGKYTEQVKRYLDLFSESQIKIFLFEEVKTDFQKMVEETLLFLGIQTPGPAILSENQNASFDFNHPFLSAMYRSARIRKGIKKIMPEKLSSFLMKKITRKTSVKIPEKLHEELREFYREDIMALSKLINKDLTAWLT